VRCAARWRAARAHCWHLPHATFTACHVDMWAFSAPFLLHSGAHASVPAYKTGMAPCNSRMLMPHSKGIMVDVGTLLGKVTLSFLRTALRARARACALTTYNRRTRACRATAGR